jgi:hypothetical protein
MGRKYTIQEIKNYILKQDSLGDVLYNLNHDKIMEANQLEEIEEFSDEMIDSQGNMLRPNRFRLNSDGDKMLCDLCEGDLSDHESCCPYYTRPDMYILVDNHMFLTNYMRVGKYEYKVDWAKDMKLAHLLYEEEAIEIGRCIGAEVKTIYDDDY